MKFKSKGYILALVMGAAGGLIKCSVNKEKTADKNQISQQIPQNNDANQASPMIDSKAKTFEEEPEPDVPDFAEASLGNRFNRNRIQTEIADPADKDKVFKLQRLPYYRALWFDIRKNNWANFDKFSAAVDEADKTGFLQNFFKAPAKGIVPYMSIFQVLTGAAEANLEKFERFVVIGHTAVVGFDFPSFPTASIALIGTDQTALREPAEYNLVFNLQGPTAEEVHSSTCQKIQKLAEEQEFPDPVDEAICNFYTAENMSPLHTFYGQQYKSEDLLRKKSVAIWQPVPHPGYQCLGYLATNGETSQPFLNSDGAGTVAETVRRSSQALQATLDYASYCVKETYLSPGTFGKVIAYNQEKKLALVQVIAADNSGYSEANLFVAINGAKKALQEQMKTMKLWVLNKKYLKILPDLKSGKHEYKP